MTDRAPNLGDVIVAATPADLARLSAHLLRALVAEAVAARGVARIAISGGSTPRAMCRVLATLPLPWADTCWFWVDDRAVPPDSPRSNQGAAREDLFSRPGVTPREVHPMPAAEADLEGAAKAYEETMAASFGLPAGAKPPVVPSFDVLLLGIGDDGHTASLFPGDGTVHVDDRWVLAVPAAEGREARLSLTTPVICAARRVLVLAQGESKRGPIARARGEGALDETPSRLTRGVQGELLWLVDAAARPA